MLTHFGRLIQCVLAVIAISAIVACSPKKDTDSSVVSISIPTISGKQNASAAIFDFSRACFAINVTASDITYTKAPNVSCEVPLGIFSGFAGPGQTLSLSVPRGTGRKLEVFSYIRNATESACPAKSDMSGISFRRLVRVGEVPSFDANAPSIDLTVTLSPPATSDNLLTQYGLAQTCAPKLAPPPVLRSTTIGRARLTGGNYVMDGALTPISNEVSLSGGSYKMLLTRKPAGN